jgi:hypothetical protein
MAPVGKAKETAATPWFEERVAPDTKTRQLVVRFRHRSLYPLPQVAAATALLLFLWWANVPVAQVVCSSPPYSKFKAPETGDQVRGGGSGDDGAAAMRAARACVRVRRG